MARDPSTGSRNKEYVGPEGSSWLHTAAPLTEKNGNDTMLRWITLY